MAFEIRNPMEYRAALYVRLSKEDEREGPSESVTNQLSLLHTFVQQHRLTVYDTYIDDGWSGTNFERPDFQRMIHDIETKKVNMVITKDLSRLGRDYIMTGHYMERYFPEKQVRYLSLLDGIDTGIESTANEITPFRALMNDWYAKDISKKIKSVKRDKQRKGQFIGGKAVYGYQICPTEKNRLIPDEEAARVVRRIFHMALEGMSCRAIACQLNEEHIPTPAAYAGLRSGRRGPYAGMWSSERISEMLQNEMYVGTMVQGKRVKLSYKSKKCLRQRPEDWVVVEGTHVPLIDMETFRQVGLLVRSRRHTRSRTYDFLLKGIIVCHECGYPLAVLNRKNAAGEDVLYFVCRTYQRFTKAGVCSCHSIQERKVTDAVLETVREVCGAYWNVEQEQWMERMALKKIQEVQQLGGGEELALRAEIGRLTAHLDQMYLDRLNGLRSEHDFTRLYKKVERERDSLEERLGVLAQERESQICAQERAKGLVRQFLRSLSTSREMLVSLIERVELTENKQIIIQFRFRGLEAVF